MDDLDTQSLVGDQISLLEQALASQNTQGRALTKTGENSARALIPVKTLVAQMSLFAIGHEKARKFTALELKAALALLGKALPDVRSVSVDLNIRHERTKEDMAAELESRGVDIEGIWSRIA